MSNSIGIEIETIKGTNNEIQNVNPQPSLGFQTNQQGVYDQLNQHFSEQDRQQKTVQETRGILGESASTISDEQVFDLVNEIQYLVDSWLEEYEKKIFDGKTLDQMLGLKST